MTEPASPDAAASATVTAPDSAGVSATPVPTLPTPVPSPLYRGVATYYGWDFQGRPMASGPAFNLLDPTVTASNYWPLGTRLRVWRVAGSPWDGTLSAADHAYYFSHSIDVTVLDRGAFTHALDLSAAAFALLGRPDEGVIAVEIMPVDGIPPWSRPCCLPGTPP
ncbi:MAG TPA: septal ring lytic transglycosylase RlpA family protein [Dehalococcoidia bacterium]|nr:septal ring lytic transglycosylase RlpA family protein [Dehalococcoidia bacterium]